MDLGHQHTLTWIRWAPDRSLNPQYQGLPDVDRAGASIEHLNPVTGEPCLAMVHFDVPPINQVFPGSALWQVESWEPLTLHPSILCGTCRDHGYIRQGRWLPI